MGFKPEDVKKLRTKFRLTPGQFAKKLRVDARSVLYWETGERVPTPPVQVLLRLLDAGIDYDILLKEKDGQLCQDANTHQDTPRPSSSGVAVQFSTMDTEEDVVA